MKLSVVIPIYNVERWLPACLDSVLDPACADYEVIASAKLSVDIPVIGNGGIFSEEDAVEIMRRQSRDNARTPMQWNDSENAGFTSGKPWLRVNPNYVSINAEDQLRREDSVYRYYQKLIRLRKESDLIVYGDFQMLCPESEEIFAYVRTLNGMKLIVVCNFTDHSVDFSLPEEFEGGCRIIGNYEDGPSAESLRPY